MTYHILKTPRFLRASPQRQGVRSCPVVGEAGRLEGVGAIEDWTSDWNSKAGVATGYGPYSGNGRMSVVEMTGPKIIANLKDAIEFLKAVGHSINFTLHRPWNIVGLVVVDKGDKQTTQIVIDYASASVNYIGEDSFGDLCALIAEDVRKNTLWSSYDIESWRWLMLTDADSKYWSPSGGIAPLWVYVKDKDAPTKAMIDPSPRQILEGAPLEAIGQARSMVTKTQVGPLPVPGKTDIPGSNPPAETSTSVWPLVAVGLLLAALAAYSAQQQGKTPWHTKW
jgi:hypothetical protein